MVFLINLLTLVHATWGYLVKNVQLETCLLLLKFLITMRNLQMRLILGDSCSLSSSVNRLAIYFKLVLEVLTFSTEV